MDISFVGVLVVILVIVAIFIYLVIQNLNLL